MMSAGYSYFKRQLERTHFSNNIHVFRLKQKFLLKKALFDMGRFGPAAPLPNPDNDGGHAGALDDLPDFPAEIDLGEHSGEDACEAEIADDDSEMPLPAEFFDPLPSPLPIGLPQKAPHGIGLPPQCTDIEEVLAKLESDKEAVNPKDHMKSVKAHATAMKRPASAVPLVQAKPKKSAGPAAYGVVENGVEDPEEVLINNVSLAPEVEHKLALMKCIDVCSGPLVNDQQGKIVESTQRGTYICQIKDLKAKRMICMVTDKQFGSKERAKRAADVLQELFLMGVGPADLQMANASGGLFGVSCGKQSTKKHGKAKVLAKRKGVKPKKAKGVKPKKP